MRHADVEKFCLSLPATTLVVQWGDSRVYKVGGKVFAVLCPTFDKPHHITFRVAEDSFEILTEDPAFVQAPYFASRRWVSLERLAALSTKEMKAYLTRAHALVAAGLPKKKQAELGLASLSSPAKQALRSDGKASQVHPARRSSKVRAIA
jgi:predicted DNA-binding protein (MmcQ/YjbR family)